MKQWIKQYLTKSNLTKSTKELNMATNLVGTLAFTEACQRVIAHCPNEYAKRYAREGLKMTDRGEIAYQALYILSNTVTWRGDEAKMVKAALREFGKYQG
jgi:hypothetical protein